MTAHPTRRPSRRPMASRAGAGGYPAYPGAGDAHVGGGGGGGGGVGGRYMQQPPFVPYPRETHYGRPAADELGCGSYVSLRATSSNSLVVLTLIHHEAWSQTGPQRH
nr:uncharacterized protein LOC128699336 [Cherax quadricarinatus]